MEIILDRDYGGEEGGIVRYWGFYRGAVLPEKSDTASLRLFLSGYTLIIA